MTDIFDGDPLILIGPNGADFVFIGGQPKMDTGFENHVNISMLTEPGWFGNDIEPIKERKIGSTYLAAVQQPITRQSLIDVDKAAESDVKGDEFGTVTAETTNPVSQQLNTEIIYTTPTGDIEKLRLTRTGQNWLSILEAGENGA